MKQLAWVRAILEHRKWSQTELARRAGIDPSTLSRFLRESTPGANLNSHTVAAIEKAGGILAFETSPPQLPRGISSTEASTYEPEEGDPVASAVAALTQGRNQVSAWVMQSRALENAGYLPGDVLVVEIGALPAPGDAVCAQIFDRSGKGEIAFRIYEYPYLVAASTDPELRRPILVDNERAQVTGVVLASIRPRLARH